MKAQYYPQK